MAYQIESTLRGQLVATETWDDLLFESAKEHARTLVENGIADRVEIRDANGSLVFHYPRVMRPAWGRRAQGCYAAIYGPCSADRRIGYPHSAAFLKSLQ